MCELGRGKGTQTGHKSSRMLVSRASNPWKNKIISLFQRAEDVTQTLSESSDFSRHQVCKRQDKTSCFIFCTFITLKLSFLSCLPHCFRRKKVGFCHFHQREGSGAHLGMRWPEPRFPPLSFPLEHATVCNVRSGQAAGAK